MANLDFIERQYFEELFSMGTGYVLDFSNRTFQEFVYEKVNIDVYARYEKLSKAKMLRNIMSDYNDTTVGKLLLELMRYMQAKNMVGSGQSELFNKCAEIGNRLIGRSTFTRKQAKPETAPKPPAPAIDFDSLLKELYDISRSDDTPQERGFAFEKYLRKLFDIYGLEPRGSFKLTGEQIDGSFVLEKEVYLLEAKWTNKKINLSDLVFFNSKVASKSAFTRGLFISLSGYSDEALQTFANGREVKIILMSVQELAIALSRKLDLSKVLSAKVRILAETGNYNKSVFDI